MLAGGCSMLLVGGFVYGSRIVPAPVWTLCDENA